MAFCHLFLYNKKVMKLPEPGKEKLLLEMFGKRVVNQKFVMPDGNVIDYLVFQSTNPVIIFPLTEDKKVIVLKQFRFGSQSVITELPGGNPKKSETPEDIAQNELMEEAGYSFKKLIKLSDEVWLDPATFRSHYTPFLALGCKKEKEQKPDSTELIELLEVPLEKWILMIFNGEIVDSKTIAVTCLALPHLGYKLVKN